MASFPYQELRGIDIRLLDLLPGSHTDPLRCSIRHAPLAASTAFEALSYTWGPPPESRQITINRHKVPVRPNLFTGLMYLRRPDRTRTIWIDALCINQSDIEERDKQVLRMRDIYSMATSVQVWLGEAGEEDALALQLVREISAVVQDPEDLLNSGTQNSYIEQWEPLFNAAVPKTIKALNDLFNRPWWTRVWIVQELSLAKQPEAHVICGSISMPWLSFLVAAYAVEELWNTANHLLWSEYPDEPLNGFQTGIRMAQCRYSDATFPRFRLLELLNQHRDCEATNARDYVYGLLGMSGDGEQAGIVPRYAASVIDIYTDLVRKLVRATESLDVLCACRGERNLTALPSWVPDWSTDAVSPSICLYERYCGGNDFVGSPIAHFERYRASGTSKAEAHFAGPRLSVRACIIGRIQYLGILDDGMQFEDIESFGVGDDEGKSASGSDNFDNWLNLILDCPMWPKIEERYGSPSAALDAFCRTLVANRNNRMMVPPLDDSAESDSDDIESGER